MNNPLTAPLRHAGSAALGVALLGASAVAGIVWVSIAAQQWLEPRTGAALAALLVGLIFIAPLLLYLLVNAIVRMGNETRVDMRPNPAQTDEAIGLVLHRVQDFVRDRPVVAVVATVILGMLMTRFPGAAGFIIHTLRQPSTPDTHV